MEKPDAPSGFRSSNPVLTINVSKRAVMEILFAIILIVSLLVLGRYEKDQSSHPLSQLDNLKSATTTSHGSGEVLNRGIHDGSSKRNRRRDVNAGRDEAADTSQFRSRDDSITVKSTSTP